VHEIEAETVPPDGLLISKSIVPEELPPLDAARRKLIVADPVTRSARSRKYTSITVSLGAVIWTVIVSPSLTMIGSEEMKSLVRVVLIMSE